MKLFKSMIVLVFTLFFLDSANAQRPVLNDDEVIKNEVVKEVDEMYKCAEFIKQKNKNFLDVHGTMIIDISVIKSGKVATFFKVESEIKNIDFINFMSHYILDYKFKFKLPKGKQSKIRYTVTF